MVYTTGDTHSVPYKYEPTWSFIPVIICSSRNYKVPEILGSVWYNELSDIELAFREVLSRLT